MTSRRTSGTARSVERVSVDLSAVMVAVSGDAPQVLVVRADEPFHALPSGPLEPEHRTLERGLRAWIAEHTGQPVGYVEQLYTFGDRNRNANDAGVAVRALSIGYLALVPVASDVGRLHAAWRDWYRYFPWEDWRDGEPKEAKAMRRLCRQWVAEADAKDERDTRGARVRRAFGPPGERWNEELVLERYELLYEVGLVAEARPDGSKARADSSPTFGEPMLADHRRILATAIARLRGKIKYRPVVFQLIPPTFTLSRLQRTVEALAGIRLHAPNFRRLVESQRLVEDTGGRVAETHGRPARLVRFRRDVMLEQPGFAARLPIVRTTA